MSDAPTAPDLSAIPESAWAEARRCFPVIHRLIDTPRRRRSQVIAAAAELGLSRSQVYKLLARFTADPRLTSLLPNRRGPTRGGSRLSCEINQLIDETIESVYLTRQRARLVDLVTEIRRRCRAAGLAAPSRKAVTARVRAKPRREVVARRHGQKHARDQYAPAIGALEASWPLSLVQIDHTLVDVIVVDSVTRAPIQRPWLTLAIDVWSRCVVGFHLSLEAPSATSVALCISHAVLPKSPWLAERKIDAEWPVHGLFSRLHLDNGKDFHSEALRRGCEQYGIAIDYRPVRTPHYGGHIERLIGTMMGKVHLLPGTTFSNIAEKGDTDPEKTAAMTLDELERWLALAISGVYHRTVHRALEVTPLAAWERGLAGDGVTLGCGEPARVSDARRFLIDFLPLEHRLIRRDGVSLHSIHYWSDILRSWIGEPRKVIVRYDPRDLSRLYLLAPDGQYYDLHYRNLRRPPISLWEHRLALKRLRDEGRQTVDENAIFRAIDTMRSIADEATQASKTARRQRERRLRVIQGGRVDPPPAPPSTNGSTGAPREPSTQPWERMLPVEEWS
jgi:putative transposase